MKLYEKYAPYFALLTPKEKYAKEANYYRKLLSGCKTVLELGSGGGHNAYHLKKHFNMTLVDISPKMLKSSKQINPKCEHIVGDIRYLNLVRKFDAVFIHDAIAHINNKADLRKVIQTAYKHCDINGTLLICPDFIAENFVADIYSGGSDDASGQGIRYLEWRWKPSPKSSKTENIYYVDMIYAIKDKRGVLKIDHERFNNGLFARKFWLSLLRREGFTPTALKDQPTISNRELFIAKRSQ